MDSEKYHTYDSRKESGMPITGRLDLGYYSDNSSTGRLLARDCRFLLCRGFLIDLQLLGMARVNCQHQGFPWFVCVHSFSKSNGQGQYSTTILRPVLS